MRCSSLRQLEGQQFPLRSFELCPLATLVSLHSTDKKDSNSMKCGYLQLLINFLVSDSNITEHIHELLNAQQHGKQVAMPQNSSKISLLGIYE